MNHELKSTLRRQFRGIVANPAISARVCDHLQEWPVWKAARTIMGFVALASEPDVMPALRRAFERGATIAFPIVDGDALRIGAVSSLHNEHFRADVMGVPGPIAWTPIDASSLDLVLVPGVAFDRAGGRLGRGGGHYDRFVSGLAARTATVGVADARRVVDAVPMEPHDRRVQWLVSDADAVAPTRPGLPI